MVTPVQHNLKTKLDSFLNIFKCFLFTTTLTDTTWNSRAFHNPYPIFISIHRYEKFHKILSHEMMNLFIKADQASKPNATETAPQPNSNRNPAFFRYFASASRSARVSGCSSSQPAGNRRSRRC